MFIMGIYPGQQAARALLTSGQLAGRDLPISAEDVLRFLEVQDSYALIGFENGAPNGYAVVCKRTMEQLIPELFILQVASDGGALWVNEGWKAIHTFARKIGCHRIGTVLPYAEAPALMRRFGFEPQGVYCTALLRGDDTQN